MLTVNNTIFTGKVLIEFKQLDSTNDYAMSLVRSDAAKEGMLITTKDQTKGKGQRGRVWQSQAGKNIAMSVIYQPNTIHHKQAYLNKCVAIACHQLIAEQLGGEEVRIKWPNDIYYQDQKLAGILIENVYAGNQLTNSVIGIGINVNQVKFPDELVNPISLKLIVGGNLHISSLIVRLCELLEQQYLLFKRDEWGIIQANYLERLYRFQEVGNYMTSYGELSGRITDVNENGQLVLQTDANEFVFNVKELEFL